MYMASVDYYSTGLLDLALLARYLLYSCIRTGVQVLFSNNYFQSITGLGQNFESLDLYVICCTVRLPATGTAY